jgi:molybdopterin-guanine dinucleotide biosynthesis protein A
MKPIVAIMAGGESRRMGADKAALVVGGETILLRVARTAVATSLGVHIAGRPRPRDWPLPEVTFHKDDEAGLGPLGGLATILRRSDGPVVALGCDMPLLDTEAIEWLVGEAAARTLEDGLVTVSASGKQQPLFSVYMPAVLALVERHLQDETLALKDLTAAGRFRLLPVPRRWEQSIRGFNTPEEYELHRTEIESGADTD